MGARPATRPARRRRAGRGLLIVLAAVLTLVLAGTGSAAADPTTAGGGGGRRYVALGDAWAAGTVAGVLDPTSGSCRRSAAAYPALLGPSLAGTAWTSRACASSTSGGNGQFDTLGAETEVISITVGSDATGLGALARACSRAGDTRACDAAAVRFDRALSTLPGTFDAAMADLHTRAPRARLVVTTFPLIAEGAVCAAGPSDEARARRLDDAVARLDAVLLARGAATGARTVDVRAAFRGHGVCSRDPWLAPLTGSEPLLAGSATAAGHRQGFLPGVTAATGTSTDAAPAAPPVRAAPPDADRALLGRVLGGAAGSLFGG